MAGPEPGDEDTEKCCQSCEALGGCGEVAHGRIKVMQNVDVSVCRRVLDCRTTASGTSWKETVVGFEGIRYTRV